jgi:SanA protein
MSIFFFLIFFILFLALPRLFMILSQSKKVSTQFDSSKYKTIIVFGAGLRNDGTPTNILQDRVKTALIISLQKGIKHIIFSGSITKRGSEPNQMYALVDQEIFSGISIILDQLGNRTFDTCLRLKSIYSIRNAIFVTQKFHLPRALFIAEKLGIEAIGIPADRSMYKLWSRFWWNLREFSACTLALLDIAKYLFISNH